MFIFLPECDLTHNRALSDHRLEVLAGQCLLEQMHQIELDGFENDVACQEKLIGFTEAQQLELPHELPVLLRAFTHLEMWCMTLKLGRLG